MLLKQAARLLAHIAMCMHAEGALASLGCPSISKGLITACSWDGLSSATPTRRRDLCAAGFELSSANIPFPCSRGAAPPCRHVRCRKRCTAGWPQCWIAPAPLYWPDQRQSGCHYLPPTSLPAHAKKPEDQRFLLGKKRYTASHKLLNASE